MPKTKPFLTYNQQISKLAIEKHIVIDDAPSAKIALKRIGYFSIIGGYKTPFINPMTHGKFYGPPSLVEVFQRHQLNFTTLLCLKKSVCESAF